MTQDHTIVLHTYSDLTEAEMMREKLEEKGIKSFINDENVMGLDPVGGVELKIFEKDKAEAERILAG